MRTTVYQQRLGAEAISTRAPLRLAAEALCTPASLREWEQSRYLLALLQSTALIYAYYYKCVLILLHMRPISSYDMPERRHRPPRQQREASPHTAPTYAARQHSCVCTSKASTFVPVSNLLSLRQKATCTQEPAQPCHRRRVLVTSLHKTRAPAQ